MKRGRFAFFGSYHTQDPDPLTVRNTAPETLGLSLVGELAEQLHQLVDLQRAAPEVPQEHAGERVRPARVAARQRLLRSEVNNSQSLDIKNLLGS